LAAPLAPRRKRRTWTPRGVGRSSTAMRAEGDGKGVVGRYVASLAFLACEPVPTRDCRVSSAETSITPPCPLFAVSTYLEIPFRRTTIAKATALKFRPAWPYW